MVELVLFNTYQVIHECDTCRVTNRYFQFHYVSFL